MTAARQAVTYAERSLHALDQGAAHRALGEAYRANANRYEAESAFRRSLEILEDIQSRPELGQTLLAYGRFKRDEDADEGDRLLNRALELFQDMDAPGWIEETRTALDT